MRPDGREAVVKSSKLGHHVPVLHSPSTGRRPGRTAARALLYKESLPSALAEAELTLAVSVYEPPFRELPLPP